MDACSQAEKLMFWRDTVSTASGAEWTEVMALVPVRRTCLIRAGPTSVGRLDSELLREHLGSTDFAGACS